MTPIAPENHHRLVTLAAFVVVSAGLSLGKTIVVPVALSLLIVVVSRPAYEGLQRRGTPAWAARLILMGGALAALGGLFLACAATLRALITRLPLYEAQFAAFQARLDAAVVHYPAAVKELAALMPAPDKLAEALQGAVHMVGAQLWPAWLLVFLVQLALQESDAFPGRVSRLFPDAERFLENWRLSAGYVRRWLVMRSLVGLLRAAVTYVLLHALGVGFPAAWALLAVISAYLPDSFGQPLAIAPPAFMAMIGPGPAAAVAIVIVLPVVAWACDEIFEDAVGASVKMSNFQAAVATLYWTLLLGPFGALLALPLTVMARAAMASFDGGRPAAVLMYREDGAPETEPLTRP